MAKKKQKVSEVERELKATAKRLRAQLAVAEKSAEKWKAKAKDHRSLAAGAKTELTAVRRRLAKAEATVTKWRDRARQPAPAAAVTAPPARSTSPDDTWSITRLRAEARSRGVVRYSRKTKDELLADLRR